jgi:hypothetical protein
MLDIVFWLGAVAFVLFAFALGCWCGAVFAEGEPESSADSSQQPDYLY